MDNSKVLEISSELLNDWRRFTSSNVYADLCAFLECNRIGIQEELTAEASTKFDEQSNKSIRVLAGNLQAFSRIMSFVKTRVEVLQMELENESNTEQSDTE